VSCTALIKLSVVELYICMFDTMGTRSLAYIVYCISLLVMGLFGVRATS
jgi:hypothetical protein